MPTNSKKRTQVSVALNELEKECITKQSFRQNRSVSQIMRFAIKKYLDGLENSYMKPIEEDSVEQIFLKLCSQLAKNADILYALNIILIELELKEKYLITYFSDNVTAITGYDKFDLLEPSFFESRIHPDQSVHEIFLPNQNSNFWEHKFKFKKPDGEYRDTRICLKKTDDDRVFATWQFIKL